MITKKPPRPLIQPSVARKHHRFTVDQYEKMTEQGLLTSHDRVELLEGMIVDKMTQYPPHNATIDLLREALKKLLPQGWMLREQKAIRLVGSEPEPDLVVARGPARRYAMRHPAIEDLALVIEVAVSSLAEDQGRKLQIYARARIPVYWIANLIDGQIEVYSEPIGGKSPGYRKHKDYALSDQIPVVIDQKGVGKIRVSDVMP